MTFNAKKREKKFVNKLHFNGWNKIIGCIYWMKFISSLDFIELSWTDFHPIRSKPFSNVLSVIGSKTQLRPCAFWQFGKVELAKAKVNLAKYQSIWHTRFALDCSSSGKLYNCILQLKFRINLHLGCSCWDCEERSKICEDEANTSPPRVLVLRVWCRSRGRILCGWAPRG